MGHSVVYRLRRIDAPEAVTDGLNKKPTHEAVWWAENEPSVRRVGTRRDPLGVSELAEHGTPDLNRVRPPFIQVLVQKSVTTITNVAGRLTASMLREDRARSQGERRGNLHQSGVSGGICTEQYTLHHGDTVESRGILVAAFAFPCLSASVVNKYLLLRLRPACRRNDSIHPQVFDHLSVMVHWMSGRERPNSKARHFHLTKKSYLIKRILLAY